MKIHNKRIKTTELMWWVGEIIECYHCDCRFELEEIDKPERKEHQTRSRDLTDLDVWKIRCPECGNKNNVRISGA